MALDSYRSRGGYSVSESGATRARLHAGGHSPDTARTLGNPACRIHGRLHVHGGYAAQLGQLLFDRRFLPPLSEKGGKRIAFRQRFTVGDGVSGVGGCSREALTKCNSLPSFFRKRREANCISSTLHGWRRRFWCWRLQPSPTVKR